MQKVRSKYDKGNRHIGKNFSRMRKCQKLRKLDCGRAWRMRNAESTFCFGSHLPQLVQQIAASKHGGSEEGDLLTFHKLVNIMVIKIFMYFVWVWWAFILKRTQKWRKSWDFFTTLMLKGHTGPFIFILRASFASWCHPKTDSRMDLTFGDFLKNNSDANVR